MKVTPWDGQPISAPGIYSGVPMSAYHGSDLCVGPSISSSGLRTIFNKSPMVYWVRSPYNPNALDPEDKAHFVVGRAAHHLLLGEAYFDKEFIVRPAEYPDQKTGELKKWTKAAHYCKNWEEDALESGLTILSPSDIETITGLAGLHPWQKGLEDSGLINNLQVKGGALNGLIEHTIIAQDKETGVWIKARPDVIPLDSREATDFKTTLSVERHKLMRTLDDLRYDMQADLISECLEQAADCRLTAFSLVFACKPEPHEVAFRELKPFDLSESSKDNRTALRMFAMCMERNRWPGIGGRGQDAAYLERSDTSRARAEERRKYLEEELMT